MASFCIFVCLEGCFLFCFEGAGDAGVERQLAQAGFQPENISRTMDVLREYRESMLVKDAFRSLLFVALAFVALALYVKDKLKSVVYVVSILSLLTL